MATIREFGQYEKVSTKFNTNKLLAMEMSFFKQNKLNPKIDFKIQIILMCSTINGRIYDNKKQIFSSDHVMKLINRINNRNGTFYNDRGIWESLCRVERGKVSNRMRFSIYQRDGYRCKMCGRYGVTDFLEVDHIKPIAKGGKSTYDNLQTLCRRCNKDKGDSY